MNFLIFLLFLSVVKPNFFRNRNIKFHLDSEDIIKSRNKIEAGFDKSTDIFELPKLNDPMKDFVKKQIVRYKTEIEPEMISAENKTSMDDLFKLPDQHSEIMADILGERFVPEKVLPNGLTPQIMQNVHLLEKVEKFVPKIETYTKESQLFFYETSNKFAYTEIYYFAGIPYYNFPFEETL